MTDYSKLIEDARFGVKQLPLKQGQVFGDPDIAGLERTAIGLADTIADLQKQLAAALAACKAKDGLLKSIIKTPHMHQDAYTEAALELARKALAIQPDDSALQAYRNSVIEECAKLFEDEDIGIHESTAKAWRNPPEAVRALRSGEWKPDLL